MPTPHPPRNTSAKKLNVQIPHSPSTALGLTIPFIILGSAALTEAGMNLEVSFEDANPLDTRSTIADRDTNRRGALLERIVESAVGRLSPDV
ncbi:hypothetical protein BBP40_001857 [Aspergillus hancockii]|nr:hypothetical protein BBP40_001857 [Aspergillus hancockii]